MARREDPTHRSRLRLAGRARPSLQPHQQIALLLLLFTIAGAAIMGLGVLRLDAARDSLTVANRFAPASRALEQTLEHFIAAQLAYRKAIAGDDGAAALTRSAREIDEGRRAFSRYERVAPSLPGDARLRRQIERDIEILTETGTLSVLDPSAAGAAEVTNRSEILQADIRELHGLYDVALHREVSTAASAADATLRDALIAFIVGFVIVNATGVIVMRSTKRREGAEARVRAERSREARLNDLEARLQRSFEMAHTEDATYVAIGDALRESTPEVESELLLADTVGSHFRQVTTGARPRDVTPHDCRVGFPGECPAATRGQTLVFPTSRIRLGTCPYVRDQGDDDHSATCVPVSIAGEPIGVIHTSGPDGAPPGAEPVKRVELVAQKAGERLGMLRAFERTENEAQTDPLTGLLNRRSLEAKVRTLVQDELSYVTAYGDLDHFKWLNDEHGHDAGDRALRLFARVLRDSVRPGDVAARFGGEEFVVVLPECSVPDAVVVLERLRTRLSSELAASALPPFTVSFGVADSRHGSWPEVLEAADAALLDAKAAGRDRVVVAGEIVLQASDTPGKPDRDHPSGVRTPERG